MSCQFPLLRDNDARDLGQLETDSETFVLAYNTYMSIRLTKHVMNLF